MAPGLNYLALHFNAPGEIAAIEPDPADIRTEEYALFCSAQIRERLHSGDIELLGMRGWRDNLRRGAYAV
jgi:hypothetical protein